MNQPQQDAELLDVSDQTKGVNALAEEVMERCIRIVANVNRFKQPRLDRIKLYRDLYAGNVKRKYRQPFNVVLPVFSGLIDTLQAEFNDDLALEFEEQEPADYLAVRKLNPLWQMEVTSVAPNAMFASKARTDRSNALFSGRGFMMNYAVSDPEYRNFFEVYELEDAIFQPSGGGIIENHLYQGRQNILRSAADLESPVYDSAQVKKLKDIAARTDYDPTFVGTDGESTKNALVKFKAMGLSPEAHDYVGEQLFKLVEMAVMVKGTRYYIVFSPWYKKWVRFDKLKSVFSSDLYPATSWATHEDNKNFLSKSYADDLYGIADSVHTLFNQELTNREKRNFHPRGYDVSMFPDVAKLDQAQTRPDALVPVTVPAGKRIQDGIFTFETAELQGTINLIEWIRQETGKDVGITDLAMGGAAGATKRATVILAEQQAIAKRLLLRQSSYTEAMSRIGKLFIQAAKDHLPAKKALKRLGIEGQGWDAVISRTDLDFYADVDVSIKSSMLEMQNSHLKKEARLKVLAEIGADPILAPTINPRWRAEEMLRSGAEYDDAEIKLALDTKEYNNKEEAAYAHEAIQEIQAGKKPDTYYGATTLFMQIIHDFAVNNRSSLGMRMFNELIDYEMAHAPIVQENLARRAQAAGAAAASPDPNAAPADGAAGGAPSGAPGAAPKPNPTATPILNSALTPPGGSSVASRKRPRSAPTRHEPL